MKKNNLSEDLTIRVSVLRRHTAPEDETRMPFFSLLSDAFAVTSTGAPAHKYFRNRMRE
jgi:hypothetical protein